MRTVQRSRERRGLVPFHCFGFLCAAGGIGYNAHADLFITTDRAWRAILKGMGLLGEPDHKFFNSGAALITRAILFVPIFIGLRILAIKASVWAYGAADAFESGIGHYFLLFVLFILCTVIFSVCYGLAMVVAPGTLKWGVVVAGVVVSILFGISKDFTVWTGLAEWLACLGSVSNLLNHIKKVREENRYASFWHRKEGEE